jgi:hypothetical protein
LAEYTLVPDCGPDGDAVWLTICLPQFRARPSVRRLRTLAELYALGTALNAEGQQRFGLDVVSTRIESEDGDTSIIFELDPDFSDVYDWREKLMTSATRIIVKHGGTVKRW